jgi:hypothetical protein
MMLIEEGIGGFGDKTKEGEAKDEDAAEFETVEESKTGDHIEKHKTHRGGKHVHENDFSVLHKPPNAEVIT